MKGSKRCRMHGGASLKGIASPAFKHGRYSKTLPPRLLEHYNTAVQDQELLSVREDIALVDARLADLLKRVDTGESGKLWELARKATDDLRMAMNNENYGGVSLAVDKLDRLIGSGLTDHAAWSNLLIILDQRRRLVESEQKRLVAMEQMITSEQAMMLIAGILDSLKQNIKDRHVLNAINADLMRLVGSTAK